MWSDLPQLGMDRHQRVDVHGVTLRRQFLPPDPPPAPVPTTPASRARPAASSSPALTSLQPQCRATVHATATEDGQKNSAPRMPALERSIRLPGDAARAPAEALVAPARRCPRPPLWPMNTPPEAACDMDRSGPVGSPRATRRTFGAVRNRLLDALPRSRPVSPSCAPRL